MWYWIDTGWGCGGIITSNGIVVDGAPIFRKLRGQLVSKLSKYYNIIPLGGSND